jgi:dihydrofolate synthase/folylpolyglutamate synthase
MVTENLLNSNLITKATKEGTNAFSSISKAFEWLEKTSPSTLITPGLESISKVATKLGLNALHKQSKIITVAGSNGKGSTCFFAEQIALSHNHKVGLYTSPHLTSFNERIRIDGNNISDKKLLNAFNIVLKASLHLKTQLSYFEFTTLCALYCFKETECRLIILEVGLGGRLDATNIIHNHCAIITSISLEHTQWLGNTLSEIAAEKAGIIKQNETVILTDNLPQKCRDIAKEKRATIYQYNKDFHITTTSNHLLTIKTEEGNTLKISIAKNSTTCFQTNKTNLEIDWIRLKNLSLSILGLFAVGVQLQQEKITQAVNNTTFSGRLEPFSYGKLQGWLDVAHNPEAVTNLLSFIEKLENKVDVVFACLADKEIDKIISLSKAYIQHWHLIDMQNPRAIGGETMKKTLLSQDIPIENITLYEQNNFMYEIAQKSKKSNKSIIIFGSFMLVGLAKALISQKHLNK